MEAPAPSIIRDPATWTRTVKAPPNRFTWGLFPATAGGQPNGDSTVNRQAAQSSGTPSHSNTGGREDSRPPAR
eukprot:4660034-Heterocapsa_arctica.AAC.1